MQAATRFGVSYPASCLSFALPVRYYAADCLYQHASNGGDRCNIDGDSRPAIHPIAEALCGEHHLSPGDMTCSVDPVFTVGFSGEC